MNFALGLIGLFNAVEPGIAQLVVLLKHKDGTVSVVTTLDEADATATSNLKQIADWMASHKTT